MKEKIYDKMREFGWNLGNNTNEDFNSVYDIHYNFIENCYDYIVDNDINKELDFNSLDKQEMEDMITFMSDFLRAINDIDNVKLVGSAKINLTNKSNIPLSLGYMTYGNVAQLETEIRKCKFNAKDIINMLNNNKKRLCLTDDYWVMELEIENMIILKSNNNHYLEIKL